MRDAARKMATGAIWMVLFKLCERSLGFVSTLILVRLLAPADFGLVAMATVLVALMELFTAFGFDWALIQRADPDRRHFDTAWTMNVLFGVFTATALVVAARPAASFYGEPRVAAIATVLASGALVQGFENIGTVFFRRELVFQREFVFQVTKKLAMFAVTVPLAWWLRSYWALVCGIVTGKVVGVVLSYLLHPYRPRFSLAAWADLFGFSKWLFVNNMLLFLRERAADLVIGRVAGARLLGVFSIGAEVANLPTTELVAPINRAIFPGYARVAETNGALRTAFLSVVAMIALLSAAAGMGIASIAPLAVDVLLGAAWAESIPVVQIVAVAGVLMSLQTNTYSVFLALGRPDLQTRVQAVYVAVLLPSLLIGTSNAGLEGAAFAFIVAAAVTLPLNYGLLMRRLDLKLREVVAPIWRPLVACTVMYLAVRNAIAGAETLFGGVPGLLTAIVFGALIYVGTIILLWWLAGRPDGAERSCWIRLGELVRARTARDAQ